MDSIKGKKGEHTLHWNIIYNEKYFSFPMRKSFEKGTLNESIRLFNFYFFFFFLEMCFNYFSQVVF